MATITPIAGGITSQEMTNRLNNNFDNLNEELGDIVSSIFPVNSVFFTATNTNPSTFLGGIWTQIAQGRAIVGVGTGTDKHGVEKTFIAGAEGDGEYNHELKVEEMPTHAHSTQIKQTQGKYTETTPEGYSLTAPASSTTGTISTSTTGDGESHNNIQPSFGLYIWQRTA